MTGLADAEIVIIGGGAIGCAVAYSLAQAGKRDVVLIEREDALASVTTAQAAGLVGQVRASADRVRLAMASVATFRRLQQTAEANPNWREVGSLRIALSEARVAEFRRLAAVAREAGLEAELLDGAAAHTRWPGLRADEIKAALWCPSDGYLQPHDLSMAYHHHARRDGVRFATGVQVTGITLAQGRVQGVATDRGAVRCETVINAAGAHAYHIARLAGIELPIVPLRHEYVVTVPIDGLEPARPTFRVPELTLYGRAEIRTLLLGGWEPEAMSIDPRSYGVAEAPPPIEEDWPVLANFAARFARIFPPVAEAGIRHVFSGWPTFTPDGRFIIGESSRVRGFVMAGGCNAHGVSGSAGIGGHVVEAMIERDPGPYVRSLGPDRFTEHPWEWEDAVAKARGIYESYYALSH